jgi:hypothetical protein
MAILLALILFVFGFGFSSGSVAGGRSAATRHGPAGGSVRVHPPRRGYDRCTYGLRSRDHKKPLPLRSCPVGSAASP